MFNELTEIAIESAIEVLSNKSGLPNTDIMFALMTDSNKNLTAQFNKLIASTPQVINAM